MNRLRRRLGLDGLVDALDITAPADAFHVVLEHLVGVIEERDDLLKVAEVISKVTIQFAVLGIEGGHTARGDGMDSIEQLGCERQPGNVRVTEQLDVCARPLLANCRNHGRREDEIPDRPAANDQKTGRGHGRNGVLEYWSDGRLKLADSVITPRLHLSSTDRKSVV